MSLKDKCLPTQCTKYNLTGGITNDYLCVLVPAGPHHGGWLHASLRGGISHLYGRGRAGFGLPDIGKIRWEETHSQVDLYRERNCSNVDCVHGIGIQCLRMDYQIHWRRSSRSRYFTGRLDNRLGNVPAKRRKGEQGTKTAVQLRWRPTTHPTETCGRVAFFIVINEAIFLKFESHSLQHLFECCLQRPKD